MKKAILIGTAITVAFWGNTLFAQDANQAQNGNPSGDQAQARSRDGSGTNRVIEVYDTGRFVSPLVGIVAMTLN